MGNKTDTKKLELLERQQAEDRARLNQTLTVAAQPRPVETAMEKEQLAWMDATSGKSGPLDVTKLPGMGASWGLYDSAVQRQQGDRMGRGAMQFGAQGQNPILGQLLRQQSDDVRQQESAGQFERAYRLKDAEMRGSLLPLLSMQQGRSMGLAGLASGQSQNSTNAYTQFRPARSFWQDLLLTGVSSGAQAAGALIGR